MVCRGAGRPDPERRASGGRSISLANRLTVSAAAMRRPRRRTATARLESSHRSRAEPRPNPNLQAATPRASRIVTPADRPASPQPRPAETIHHAAHPTHPHRAETIHHAASVRRRGPPAADVTIRHAHVHTRRERRAVPRTRPPRPEHRGSGDDADDRVGHPCHTRSPHSSVWDVQLRFGRISPFGARSSATTSVRCVRRTCRTCIVRDGTASTAPTRAASGPIAGGVGTMSGCTSGATGLQTCSSMIDCMLGGTGAIRCPACATLGVDRSPPAACSPSDCAATCGCTTPSSPNRHRRASPASP